MSISTYNHRLQCRPQLQPGSALLASFKVKRKKDTVEINKTAGVVNSKTHSFKALQSGNVQKGDSSEIKDQAVEVYFWDRDVSREVSIPIYPHRKVFKVSGHV